MKLPLDQNLAPRFTHLTEVGVFAYNHAVMLGSIFPDVVVGSSRSPISRT